MSVFTTRFAMLRATNTCVVYGGGGSVGADGADTSSSSSHPACFICRYTTTIITTTTIKNSLTSPALSPMISWAGTRESEHPMYRYRGFFFCVLLVFFQIR